MAKHCRPFANGSQFMDWQERNCCRCLRYSCVNGEVKCSCRVERAIAIASIVSGGVTALMARRMGYLDNRAAYTWDCPERVDVVMGK